MRKRAQLMFAQNALVQCAQKRSPVVFAAGLRPKARKLFLGSRGALASAAAKNSTGGQTRTTGIDGIENTAQNFAAGK